MPTLFTYCIPYDDGAAPNPYWGVCALVICKPAIRRSAQIGDWVVGTGSVNSPVGDASGKVVYAMKVTRKMAMKEYDDFTRRLLPNKIPDWHNPNKRLRLGDSIYDFAYDHPRLRDSVHGPGNRSRDLGGEYALLSDHFFYFGDKPVPLPHELLSIVKQGQGHRAGSNDPYVDRFLAWVNSLEIAPNILAGKPQLDLFADEDPSARTVGCMEQGDLQEDAEYDDSHPTCNTLQKGMGR